MPPVGFEPTISASERPQTYALERAATGTGNGNEYQGYFLRGNGGRCVGIAIFMCRLTRNLVASTFRNPKGMQQAWTGNILPVYDATGLQQMTLKTTAQETARKCTA